MGRHLWRVAIQLTLYIDGDLDPHLSRYTLTPLKLVYKKLRLLVDRGCIFIGHGLSKDFRIISASFTCIYVDPLSSGLVKTYTYLQTKSSTPLICISSKPANAGYP